ncbi:hypothetical protein O181_094896 [Austropuccinia psidii MF-1]|uniref:Uncharacterized protein n=1 Tax=Austropuccinia psidii MF-1 TaxID=1389203 RepID=A0A9Q3J4D5_9BASI|nr:hypothetical protein [Austropuccinia psidii MF-1]
MCQHCSTQTHSSCEGERHRVSLKTFQYKQHIKKLKSLPDIPTSESGSECPQILWDQIFPADYSQSTQSTGSQLNCTETIQQQSNPSPTEPWNDNICHSIIKV